MSVLEMNLYTTLKSELKLSDEGALKFVKAFEKQQQETLKTPIEELSNKMDLRFEQINTRFEQVNTRFEQVYTRIENIKGELMNEVKESRNEMLKWFIGLFFALALMILSLYLKK